MLTVLFLSSQMKYLHKDFEYLPKKINKKLNYKDSEKHLELLEGLIVELVYRKWDIYIKKRYKITSKF